MADNDKKAGGDLAAEQEKAPIKPEEVKVTVKPHQDNLPRRGESGRREAEQQNDRAKKLADKATDGAVKEIRKAVEQAAPDGRQAQRDAAGKAAERVGQSLPRRDIKEVQVNLPGDKPGQTDTITKPATEGPPPPPTEKKPTPKRGI